MTPHANIATIASALIVLIAIIARVPTYRVAPVFLLPILWLPWVFRNRLHLHPLHYALFAIALLLHCLGAFGFYQRSFLGLSFDIYVHFYFAFAVALVLERFFRRAARSSPWAARGMALMCMMGLGALHEIMEYVSYLLLGEEKGMLKPSTSYAFDTQRDLLNNLLGTLTALALSGIVRRRSRAAEPLAHSHGTPASAESPARADAAAR